MAFKSMTLTSSRLIYKFVRFATTESMMASPKSMTTQKSSAGVIVIGDEILRGQTQDVNSHFLCKELFNMGIKVKNVSVIADDINEIAHEVAKFSKKFTFVFTSGGVGPTHDDITFEGVAKAFNEKIVLNEQVAKMVRHYFGEDKPIDSPFMKFAHLPESAQINFGSSGKKFPIISVRNVYVFAGIPTLLQRSFKLFQDNFVSSAFHVRKVYLMVDELFVAKTLTAVNDKFSKFVSLGSYPKLSHPFYKVKLILQSESEEKVEEAKEFLLHSLPKDAVTQYHETPPDLYEILKNEDRPKLSSAINIIEECLERYKPEEICVSFNGGKDCTVILHLMNAVCRRVKPNCKDKIHAVYVRQSLPFAEAETFIWKSVDDYGVELIVKNGELKDAYGALKREKPQIKAILMGQRKTDPFSKSLQSFEETDSGWPTFMRVNPILDWTYKEVWAFLRDFSIPYCHLYDQGYTSLDSMENTHINKALQYIDQQGKISYKPAYLLDDEQGERFGRKL